MKAIKICRVCGKEYEYCKTWRPFAGNRWQDVACSPECASKYFAEVEAARNAKVNKPVEIELSALTADTEEFSEPEVQEVAADAEEREDAKEEEEIQFYEDLLRHTNSSEE
jgi:hypothetical protein